MAQKLVMEHFWDHMWPENLFQHLFLDKHVDLKRPVFSEKICWWDNPRFVFFSVSDNGIYLQMASSNKENDH
jgi:hypothetical protein